jgi:hypothetical protein
MEKTYSREQVEKMCVQSYMRGMMIQEEGSRIRKRKPRQTFVEWCKLLIDTVK